MKLSSGAAGCGVLIITSSVNAPSASKAPTPPTVSPLPLVNSSTLILLHEALMIVIMKNPNHTLQAYNPVV